jgi:hypothetical protein
MVFTPSFKSEILIPIDGGKPKRMQIDRRDKKKESETFLGSLSFLTELDEHCLWFLVAQPAKNYKSPWPMLLIG